MKRIYVLYDAQCGMCRRVRDWLARQPKFVPLVCIPLQAEDVRCRFPGIERPRPEEQLVTISDRGEVWRGAGAWLMVLWALREYREWALRLAHPALRPFAGRVCEMISQNRHLISRWMQSDPPVELGRKLATIPPEGCLNQGYCKPR